MIAESAYRPALAGLGVTIAAVAEPDAARRAAAASRLPSARLYARPAELLAAEAPLDALIVASPPRHHAEAILAGLRAGAHVLCEKPLTLDLPALERVRSAAAAANRAVYCVNNWAYSPAWARLLEAAARGAVGAVRRADIRVLRARPSASAGARDWRRDPAVAGGGILIDHGWHNLYLMRRLLGPSARLVSATLAPEGPVEEVATVRLASPDAAGEMFLSWRAGERSNAALIAGDRGIIELRDDAVVVRADGVEETARFAEKLSAGSAHPEWLAAMWPAFEAECAGRSRGQNLAEASFCLETIRAAYVGREAAHA